jgi:predicted nucleotidyltransferase
MAAGTIEIEQALREVLAGEPPDVVAAYLFGSWARGTAGSHSDVDVGVLYAPAPPPTLAGLPLDLQDRIERRLRRPAQVVVLNTAPAALVHRVLRDGRLLLDRDRAARIRFEVRARNEYFDLQPIAARYRRPPGPDP